ncbi:hypothetical protein MESS4_320058 [Mesorhizobium sp. STM 4661]|nr:hypothetical protein MESS4_320058 [Mesorhizobium sp. STM 4661]
MRQYPSDTRDPASILQQRLWALSGVSPETDLAHLDVALKISSAGPVVVKRSHSALSGKTR